MAHLLDDLKRLRLTVSSDLSAAAGALDADEPTVARDILSSDREEIAAFAARVKAGTNNAGGDEVVPVRLPAQRSRRRRALLALPAVPLVGTLAMTTAAALQAAGDHHAASATHGTASPDAAAPAAAGNALTNAPTNTLRQLAHALSHHARASQVVAVADQFHAQLSALLQSAPADSPHRDQIRRLLTAEQRLLERYPVPGVDVALAAARNLGRQLHLLQPSASPRSASPTPTPTSTSTTPSKHGGSSSRPFSTNSSRPTHGTSHTNSPSPSPSSKHSHPTQTPPPNPLSGDGFMPNN